MGEKQRADARRVAAWARTQQEPDQMRQQKTAEVAGRGASWHGCLVVGPAPSPVTRPTGAPACRTAGGGGRPTPGTSAKRHRSTVSGARVFNPQQRPQGDGAGTCRTAIFSRCCGLKTRAPLTALRCLLALLPGVGQPPPPAVRQAGAPVGRVTGEGAGPTTKQPCQEAPLRSSSALSGCRVPRPVASVRPCRTRSRAPCAVFCSPSPAVGPPRRVN